MEKKIIAVVVVGAILLSSMAFPQVLVDALVNYLPPILNTLNNKVVRIGVIASDSLGYETTAPYFNNIIEPDINAYCKKLGYNIRFDFVIKDAQGDAAKHLAIVKGFKMSGIDLFIGGGWSSQAQGSLSYVNANNMVMFSSSSTSPTLAIENDNLFRMCQSDGEQPNALAEMLWSYGIKTVVIIQRGDSWGDGLVNVFKPLWEAKGGTFAGETIRYDPGALDPSSVLNEAENQLLAMGAYDMDRAGIVLLSFNEAASILQYAPGYPDVWDVKWFGSDGTAASQGIMDDAGEQAGHVKLFSLLPAVPYTSKYNNLAERYYLLTGQDLNVYGAYQYDIAWVFAKAVLETQSAKGIYVKPLIPQICYDMYGAGGWCRLNEYGDRYRLSYNIWGYEWDGTMAHAHSYGYYDTDLGAVTWDTGLLGYTPPGP